jgi:hypothetical protein
MKNIGMLFVILIFIMPAILAAETNSDKDMDEFLAEKRAIVKETMKLTEKESAVFWPLYDDYVKIQVYGYRQWTTLIERYLKERENLSEKNAKEMITKMQNLQAQDVEVKRKYANKFSKILPYKRVFEYFILEEKIDAGLNAFVAEELPAIK